MNARKEEWKSNEVEVQPAVDRDLAIVDDVMQDVLPFTKAIFARGGLNRAPQQIGSSVLVTIEEEVFLLTAAHAMEPFRGNSVFIALDGQYVPVEGSVYRNHPGPTSHHIEQDEVDTAVLHVQGPYAARLREIAYPFENSLLLNTPYPGAYVAVGYPLKLAKREARQIFSYPMGWLLQGLTEERYQRLGISPSASLAFGMSKRVATSNGYVPRPSLRGMSGCGVWIVPRVNGIELPHRLVGLFTGTAKARGLALATNIRRHVACISHFFPALLVVEPTNPDR
jgi:hypothetical protein